MAEANFWEDRRRSAAAVKGEALQLASLPARPMAPIPLGLSEQIPAAVPMASAGAPGSPSLSEDLTHRVLSSGLPRRVTDAVLPYGAVKEVYVSPRKDAPLVIHIQDLHGQYEAQRNIAALILSLSSQMPSPRAASSSRNDSIRDPEESSPSSFLIGLEGAEGDFDLRPFRAIPDQDVKEKVGDFFMRKGLITGPEKAGLVAPAPLTLWGIENRSLYLDNVAAVKSSLKGREEGKRILDEIAARLEAAKADHYSDALKAYDQNLAAYESHQKDLSAYLETLTSLSLSLDGGGKGGGEARGSRPSIFPSPSRGEGRVRVINLSGKGERSLASHRNISLLLSALRAEKALDFQEVESERLALVQALTAKLDEGSVKRLIARSLDYRAGRIAHGEYYAHFRATCKQAGISLKEKRAFARYVDYVGLVEKINRNALLDELDALETEVGDRLARTGREKEVLTLSRDALLLSKLLRNEMTPQDWTRYQSRREAILLMDSRLPHAGMTRKMDSRLNHAGMTEEASSPNASIGDPLSSPNASPHLSSPNVLPDLSSLNVSPYLSSPNASIGDPLSSPNASPHLSSPNASIGDPHKPLPLMDPRLHHSGRDPENLSAFLSPYEDFCRLAIERNQALTDNLLAKLAETKSKTAVLVAGGFHTEGLTGLLKKHEVSCLVLTPKVGKLDETQNYLDAFARDPEPLDKLFAGEKIFIPTPLQLAMAPVLDGRESFSPLGENVFMALVTAWFRNQATSLNGTLRERAERLRRSFEDLIHGIEEASFPLPSLESVAVSENHSGSSVSVSFSTFEREVTLSLAADGGVLSTSSVSPRSAIRQSISSIGQRISSEWTRLTQFEKVVVFGPYLETAGLFVAQLVLQTAQSQFGLFLFLDMVAPGLGSAMSLVLPGIVFALFHWRDLAAAYKKGRIRHALPLFAYYTLGGIFFADFLGSAELLPAQLLNAGGLNLHSFIMSYFVHAGVNALLFIARRSRIPLLNQLPFFSSLPSSTFNVEELTFLAWHRETRARNVLLKLRIELLSRERSLTKHVNAMRRELTGLGLPRAKLSIIEVRSLLEKVRVEVVPDFMAGGRPAFADEKGLRIILSDSFVRDLSDQELALVIGHELAHLLIGVEHHELERIAAQQRPEDTDQETADSIERQFKRMEFQADALGVAMARLLHPEVEIESWKSALGRILSLANNFVHSFTLIFGPIELIPLETFLKAIGVTTHPTHSARIARLEGTSIPLLDSSRFILTPPSYLSRLEELANSDIKLSKPIWLRFLSAIDMTGLTDLLWFLAGVLPQARERFESWRIPAVVRRVLRGSEALTPFTVISQEWFTPTGLMPAVETAGLVILNLVLAPALDAIIPGAGWAAQAGVSAIIFTGAHFISASTEVRRAWAEGEKGRAAVLTLQHLLFGLIFSILIAPAGALGAVGVDPAALLSAHGLPGWLGATVLSISPFGAMASWAVHWGLNAVFEFVKRKRPRVGMWLAYQSIGNGLGKLDTLLEGIGRSLNNPSLALEVMETCFNDLREAQKLLTGLPKGSESTGLMGRVEDLTRRINALAFSRVKVLVDPSLDEPVTVQNRLRLLRSYARYKGLLSDAGRLEYDRMLKSARVKAAQESMRADETVPEVLLRTKDALGFAQRQIFWLEAYDALMQDGMEVTHERIEVMAGQAPGWSVSQIKALGSLFGDFFDVTVIQESQARAPLLESLNDPATLTSIKDLVSEDEYLTEEDLAVLAGIIGGQIGVEKSFSPRFLSAWLHRMNALQVASAESASRSPSGDLVVHEPFIINGYRIYVMKGASHRQFDWKDLNRFLASQIDRIIEGDETGMNLLHSRGGHGGKVRVAQARKGKREVYFRPYKRDKAIVIVQVVSSAASHRRGNTFEPDQSFDDSIRERGLFLNGNELADLITRGEVQSLVVGTDGGFALVNEFASKRTDLLEPVSADQAAAVLRRIRQIRFFGPVLAPVVGLLTGLSSVRYRESDPIRYYAGVAVRETLGFRGFGLLAVAAGVGAILFGLDPATAGLASWVGIVVGGLMIVGGFAWSGPVSLALHSVIRWMARRTGAPRDGAADTSSPTLLQEIRADFLSSRHLMTWVYNLPLLAALFGSPLIALASLFLVGAFHFGWDISRHRRDLKLIERFCGGSFSLLTKADLIRNLAISAHTNNAKSLLYLAAGFDLSHALTTFPSVQNVVMLASVAPNLDINDLKSAMRNETLKKRTQEYKEHKIKHGYGSTESVEDGDGAISLLALELLSIGVDPDSVGQSKEGGGISFRWTNPNGQGRTVEVRFVAGHLGPEGLGDEFLQVNTGSGLKFDAIYFKAGEKLARNLEAVLGQVSQEFAPRAVVVLNAVIRNQASPERLSQLKGFSHRVLGSFDAGRRAAYANVFDVYEIHRNISQSVLTPTGLMPAVETAGLVVLNLVLGAALDAILPGAGWALQAFVSAIIFTGAHFLIPDTEVRQVLKEREYARALVLILQHLAFGLVFSVLIAPAGALGAVGMDPAALLSAHGLPGWLGATVLSISPFGAMASWAVHQGVNSVFKVVKREFPHLGMWLAYQSVASLSRRKILETIFVIFASVALPSGLLAKPTNSAEELTPPYTWLDVINRLPDGYHMDWSLDRFGAPEGEAVGDVRRLWALLGETCRDLHARRGSINIYEVIAVAELLSETEDPSSLLSGERDDAILFRAYLLMYENGRVAFVREMNGLAVAGQFGAGRDFAESYKVLKDGLDAFVKGARLSNGRLWVVPVGLLVSAGVSPGFLGSPNGRTLVEGLKFLRDFERGRQIVPVGLFDAPPRTVQGTLSVTRELAGILAEVMGDVSTAAKQGLTHVVTASSLGYHLRRRLLDLVPEPGEGVKRLLDPVIFGPPYQGLPEQEAKRTIPARSQPGAMGLFGWFGGGNLTMMGWIEGLLDATAAGFVQVNIGLAATGWLAPTLIVVGLLAAGKFALHFLSGVAQPGDGVARWRALGGNLGLHEALTVSLRATGTASLSLVAVPIILAGPGLGLPLAVAALVGFGIGGALHAWRNYRAEVPYLHRIETGGMAVTEHPMSVDLARGTVLAAKDPRATLAGFLARSFGGGPAGPVASSLLQPEVRRFYAVRSGNWTKAAMGAGVEPSWRINPVQWVAYQVAGTMARGETSLEQATVFWNQVLLNMQERADGSPMTALGDDRKKGSAGDTATLARGVDLVAVHYAQSDNLPEARRAMTALAAQVAAQVMMSEEETLPFAMLTSEIQGWTSDSLREAIAQEIRRFSPLAADRYAEASAPVFTATVESGTLVDGLYALTPLVALHLKRQPLGRVHGKPESFTDLPSDVAFFNYLSLSEALSQFLQQIRAVNIAA